MPSLYEVRLSESAERDLASIVGYLKESASARIADRWLDALLERIDALEAFPHRGSAPRELEGLLEGDYRQLVLPPYRIIYSVVQNTVEIVLIADGRRDMAALLQQRLLSR